MAKKRKMKTLEDLMTDLTALEEERQEKIDVLEARYDEKIEALRDRIHRKLTQKGLMDLVVELNEEKATDRKPPVKIDLKRAQKLLKDGHTQAETAAICNVHPQTIQYHRRKGNL